MLRVEALYGARDAVAAFATTAATLLLMLLMMPRYYATCRCHY